jgi:hypothetical protein
MRRYSKDLSRREFVSLSTKAAGAAAMASLATNPVLGGVTGDRSGERPFVILASGAPDSLEDFAARELSRYLEKLSGTPVPVTTLASWSQRPVGTPIAVGRIGRDPILPELLPDMASLAGSGPDAFVLGESTLHRSPIWFVAGVSETGVLYGVYALLEKAGATFLISGDLLADPSPDFRLPAVKLTAEPAFERRGFLLPFPLNVQESIWGLDDYVRLIDQMAKARLNYLNLNFTGADPLFRYTFHGEFNRVGDINSWQTGFLSPMRYFKFGSGRTNQVEVGQERFAGRPYIAPPELQGIRSQEEAHRRLEEIFQGVFRHAKKRGVKIGFTMDPTEIPTNFARLMRRIDHIPAHRRIAGMRVDFTDPLFEDHTRAWLSAVYSAYPEAVDLFFWNAEGYLDYPEHRELLERYRPQFQRAKQIFEEKWMHTSPYVAGDGWGASRSKTAQDVIDADIVQMEATRRVIAISKKMRPDFTVGFGFLFRGYVVQSIDKIVGKDIPFIDFQSSAVIPIKDDVNADYFAGMGDRKRYVIPRIDDDSAMFGMPFYLRQFQRDGVFQEAKKAGSQGFVAQMFRGRGTEHHVQFLAQGAWDSALTPEAFYRRYAVEIFGERAASEMTEVFRILEDVEESRGWRSLSSFGFQGGCYELDELAGEILAQDNPFDGPDNPALLSKRASSRTPAVDSRVPVGDFIPGKSALNRDSIGQLAGALSRMKSCRDSVTPKGRAYADYLINKTEAFISHLEMIQFVADGIGAYADAFARSPRDEARLADDLAAAEQLFEKARQKARETARIFAQKIDHPSDLGILFLANVYNIQKADRIAELVHRVVAYHQGKPYWPDA